MTTITKERIEQYAHDKMMCNVNDEIRTMACMLLKVMDSSQTPYAWSFEWAACITTDGPQNFSPCIEREPPPQWAIDEGQARNVVPLYAAPPAQVVMGEALSRELFEKWCPVNLERNKWHPEFYAHLPARQQWDAWNACRTALSGNAPVIPKGWVMMPIEPTEDMIIAGFESAPNEDFSEPEIWEAYRAMSGCQQAAHKARLCWDAMIAAAPEAGKYE